jgi:hypothetical protein
MTVYIAKAMKEDPDEPVYTTKIGETREAAKQALLIVMTEKIPVTVHNLDWDKDNTRKDGWIFLVKEKKLYGKS